MVERGADPELMAMAQKAPSDFFQWFRTVDERVDQLWTPQPGPGGAMTLDLEKRVYFNTKNTDKAIGPGRSTSVMESILVDHFEELGVTLLTRHQAVAIEKDETGAVCGVLARDPGGEVHISCKAVISCTGGFANNEQMLRKYAPQYYGTPDCEPTHRFAAPTNTGDVLGLGQSVGAYLDEENFTANVFGPVHHPFSFVLFCCANQGEVVTVNMDGKRFIDESLFGGGAAAMYHQPKRIAWSILDSATREMLHERMLHSPDAAVMQNFDAEFEAEAALDTPLKVADTLEELADLIGVDKENFLNTIARYNKACETGVDEEFGKRPETMKPIVQGPFYAIYGKMACDGAFGGMLVNSKTQVYNADKSGVIPGLFATGDNASGWAMKSREEGDHRLMATNECNWAVGSGFTAGTAAAEYLATL
jgi:fumarate reductase flavoprotein subunit